MSEFKPGWNPPRGTPPPVAVGVMVVGSVRDDKPVAELVFADVTGDARIVVVGVNEALILQSQLAAFLVRAAREGP